jgi:CheY-like chemotaxis protein
MIAENAILTRLPFDGRRILILEDEFLIAMDLEQICRDHGAADVLIARTLDELGANPLETFDFDAAVVDMRLSGTSTVDFARNLMASRVPFVFATGYADPEEMALLFPGVPIVTKPYLVDDLIMALESAMART